MISEKLLQRHWISGDQALRFEIDDMRLIPRPAKQWLIEHKHGKVRAIMDYMSPSPALIKEALAAVDALKGESPVKQCEWQLVEVAVAVASAEAVSG